MPEWIALNDEGAKTWPLRDKGRTERSILVDNLASRFGGVLSKTPSAPIDRALVTTLERSTEEGAVGFLITGLNPRVRPNESYRGFVELARTRFSARWKSSVPGKENDGVVTP